MNVAHRRSLLSPHCLWVGVTVVLALGSGCNPLRPRTIAHQGYRVAPELLALEEPLIQRGKERPVIDTIGWVIGIPSRFLLWDPRIDNHHISVATEAEIAEYMAANELDHVTVRLNQYAPLQDWHRLRSNKSVGWGYRYTLGTLSVLGEAIFPGRIFGGDHYNPFTATAHIYSDVPSIGLHEAAHAKDFSRRFYQGTYALVYLIPGAPLWHEREATADVFAYVDSKADPELREEAYRILYPAYGTYVGSSLGYVAPRYSDPLYIGSVLAGHFAGHRQSIEIERSRHADAAEMVTP